MAHLQFLAALPKLRLQLQFAIQSLVEGEIGGLVKAKPRVLRNN